MSKFFVGSIWYSRKSAYTVRRNQRLQVIDSEKIQRGRKFWVLVKDDNGTKHLVPRNLLRKREMGL